MASAISKRRFLKEKKICAELGIEKRIIEIVTALRLFGFPTTGSCEGHTEKFSFPWVHFVVERPTHGKARFLAWKAKTNQLTYLLENLLRDFYQTRTVPTDQHLIVFYEPTPRTALFAEFKLHPVGSEVCALFPQEILTKEVHRQILARYQAEMLAFAEFLKNRE